MTREWTAKDVLEMSGAYWRGCAVQAAVQLDLFTLLSEGPLSENEVATKVDCNPRAFGMLVTALQSLAFLERQGNSIRAPQSAIELLSRTSQGYLGFIIDHHNHIMPGWQRLTEAVRTGRHTVERTALFTPDEKEREAFLMGMFNIARLQAARIAEALDLSGRQNLIDVGGGPGTYAIFFCLANPELSGTIFDLATTEPFALKTVEKYNLSKRIQFVAGDFIDDSLPLGQDVAWVSQVIHGETPEKAQALISNAAKSLNPGGLLCVQEFMLDDDRKGPPHAALFSLNMLVQTEGGQAYTVKEIQKMMMDAGAVEVSELAVELPESCRVLIGTMP